MDEHVNEYAGKVFGSIITVLLFSMSVYAQKDPIIFMEQGADSPSINTQASRLDTPGGIIVKNNGKYGLIDLQGQERLPVEFSSIQYKKDLDHFWVQRKEPIEGDRKEGIYTIDKGFIVDPIFSKIRYLKDYFISFTLMDGKTAFVRLDPENGLNPSAFDYKYIQVDKVINGYFRARSEAGQGLIDEYERVIIPLQYDMISLFSDQYYTVLNDQDQYAVINQKNDTLIPFNRYKVIHYPYQKGFHVVEDHNGKKGLLDDDLQLVIETKYDRVEKTVHPDFIAAMREGLWGLIDYAGTTIVPFIYDELHVNRNQRVQVTSNGKRGVLSLQNEMIIQPEYDQILPNGKHGFLVKQEKWGLISAEGTVVVSPIFDEIRVQDMDGLSYRVQIQDMTFHINSTGKCISDCPEQHFLNKYGLE